MTLDDSILAQRLRVMRRAHELGDVSAACREAGISRTLFDEWRKRFEHYGPDGLHPRRRQARRGRPPQIPPHVERLVVGQALAWPTWGCRRLSAHLARDLGTSVAPSTVQRTRRALAWAREAARRRHVHAERPGDLVLLDTFYVGKLEGVGKVWQVTACDAACSYGVARLLPELSAGATADFLQQIPVPVHREAGSPPQRVLTDGGSEFKGAFDEACQALEIRHTRTQPRHAWTSSFVERLQGTILHEHWRIAFRRQYFTSRAALQNGASTHSCGSTTSRSRITGFGCTDARRPSSSGVPPLWRANLMRRSGKSDLSTQFGVLTC